MAGASLGGDPVTIPLILTDNADFIDKVTYQSSPGVEDDFPVGATVTIVFADSAATEWEATITGSEAAWHVDKAETALIPAGIQFQIQYVDSTTDEVPYEGRVTRRVFG